LKTRHQLFIDNYIVKPFVYLLNFLVRLVGKLLSIDHSLDRDFKRIVICKFKGMGSIIQATPMIEAIRSRYPEAEITFVSTQSNRAILQKIKTINHIVTINDKNVFILSKTVLQALFKLIRHRPEVYIDLEIYSNFSTLFTLLTFSKNRIGFYLRSSSFRMGIYTQMMFFNVKAPISEVYMQIARLFGKPAIAPKLFPIYTNIQVSNFDFPKEKYILINPNASDLRIERRWGRKKFKELIHLINDTFPQYKVLIIGSKNEWQYSQYVTENTNSQLTQNIAGKTSIDELIYLIKNATLMVTNDTGPMHIGFACETPSICLFGPCSPDQYGWTSNVEIIYKNVFCSPCVHDFNIAPCNGEKTCMKLITVEEVFEAVKKRLNGEANTKDSNKKSPIIYHTEYTPSLGLVKRTL